MRAKDNREPGDARLPPACAGFRTRDADGVLPIGPRVGAVRSGDRDGACPDPCISPVRVPHRRGTGEPEGGSSLSPQRPGPGVTLVVFPVEHRSRRRVDEARQPGKAEGSGGARAAGAAHAAGSASRGAGGQLRRAVAQPAGPAERGAAADVAIPTSTIRCDRRCGARWNCCSTASFARTAAWSNC